MAKRSYDSTRRQEQARATRRRIVAAATELFVEQGYAATSIAEVARAAGVAPQTVHATFGTKAALLGEAVGVALTGDDEAVAVIDRPESRAVLTETDPDAAAAALARVVTDILERVGALIHAADSAADTDGALGELAAAGHRARLADMRTTARAFESAGLLRDDVTVESAADLMWLLASPESYRSYTRHRGWSPTRYRRWLAATLRRSIFA